MTLNVRYLACEDRDVCEKDGELIRPHYTLGKFAILEETINSLVFTLRVLVCSQLAPVLPLGGHMSMWVVAHAVVALYCLSLCVAVFFTALLLFTARRSVTLLIESLVHLVTPIR